MIFNDWLRTDFEYGANTISTFISEQQMDFLNQISGVSSLETINMEAVKMIISNHEKLIWWIMKMPLYYETENQIFVHAGVDEEAEDCWKWGTSDNIFLAGENRISIQYQNAHILIPYFFNPIFNRIMYYKVRRYL